MAVHEQGVLYIRYVAVHWREVLVEMWMRINRLLASVTVLYAFWTFRDFWIHFHGWLDWLGPSLLDFLELGSDHRDYGIHDRVGVPAASGLFCP